MAWRFVNSAAWAEAGGICFGITRLWLENLAFFFFSFFNGKRHSNKSITCRKKQKSYPMGSLHLSLPSFGRFYKTDTASQVHCRVGHIQQTFTFSNTYRKSSTARGALCQGKHRHISTLGFGRKLQRWQLLVQRGAPRRGGF